jgi:periplasmic protein TonB
MTPRLPEARPWLLSVAAHAALAAVLAPLLATPPGNPGPLRIEAGYEIPLALEEPAPPLEIEAPVPPDPAEAAAEPVLLDEVPPECRDPRWAAVPEGATEEGLPDDGAGILGIGRGGARTGPRRPRPAPPAAVEVPAPAPPPAPATPAAPTVRARPLSRDCAAPAYPARERRLGVEGVVRLRVRVAADGSVESVEVYRSSGTAALDLAAVDAVLAWRFEPALLEGAPVPDLVLVPVRFVLLSAASTREE